MTVLSKAGSLPQKDLRKRTTNNSKSSARKNKTYRVVIVSWGDAFIETEDFDPKEAKNTTPVYRKTVGFLIAKNRHGYVLATDTYDDSEEVAAKLFVPKGMVTEVTYLS